MNHKWVDPEEREADSEVRALVALSAAESAAETQQQIRTWLHEADHLDRLLNALRDLIGNRPLGEVAPDEINQVVLDTVDGAESTGKALAGRASAEVSKPGPIPVSPEEFPPPISTDDSEGLEAAALLTRRSLVPPCREGAMILRRAVVLQRIRGVVVRWRAGEITGPSSMQEIERLLALLVLKKPT